MMLLMKILEKKSGGGGGGGGGGWDGVRVLLISYMLYPAHRRVGRGNLVLIHYVPHIQPNSGGIAC